jgi:DNA-directed RNA polymerase III subunit RPC11
MRYCCPSCTYARRIEQVYHCSVKVKNKIVGDVMGGDDAWENVDKTEARYVLSFTFFTRITPLLF